MSEFLFSNDSKNLVQQKTCFKSTNNPSCIDLFVTNSPKSFQNTMLLPLPLLLLHPILLQISVKIFNFTCDFWYIIEKLEILITTPFKLE